VVQKVVALIANWRLYVGGNRMNENPQGLFKELGAAAEETIEQIRGAEENYFRFLQRTETYFPWIVGLNDRLQSYADQNIAIAFEFADRLSKAKDFQDLARIETEFIMTSAQYFAEQAKDFAEESCKTAADSVKKVLSH
jgi:Phasin protein